MVAKFSQARLQMTTAVKLARLHALIDDFTALADEIYKEVRGHAEPDIDVDCPADIAWIQKTVADFYKVPIKLMLSKSRRQNLVWPRRVAMNFCRKKTGHTTGEISRHFGNRHHGNICYAVEACQDRHAEFAKDFEQLEKLIG